MSCQTTNIKSNGIAMLIAALFGGMFMVYLPYALILPTNTIKWGFPTELGIIIVSSAAALLILVGLLSKH